MNKSILISILVGTVITAAFIGIFSWKSQKSRRDKITIGILQTASHPALDATREGFVEKLKEHWGNAVDFVVQNAQGSIPNAHTIANSFHIRSDIDAICAIATPAAKAIASVEKTKPIFIATITDPQALGLIHPTTNVTGSSDMIQVNDLIEMIQKLVPQAKTVGIIFNIAEINSVVLVEKMEKRLNELGLQVSKLGITNEADLAAALDVGLRNTDLLLAPTDHTVASAITFIANRALHAKKPFIVSDNLLVKYGALAARGVNYKKSGRQAASIAIQVLEEGKKPFEIPIAKPAKSKIVINKQTLDMLNLTIPKSIASDVELIDTEL